MPHDMLPSSATLVASIRAAAASSRRQGQAHVRPTSAGIGLREPLAVQGHCVRLLRRTDS